MIDDDGVFNHRTLISFNILQITAQTNVKVCRGDLLPAS